MPESSLIVFTYFDLFKTQHSFYLKQEIKAVNLYKALAT
jgi:hypothetical protein